MLILLSISRLKKEIFSFENDDPFLKSEFCQFLVGVLVKIYIEEESDLHTGKTFSLVEYLID